MNNNKLKSALARLPRGEGFTLLYAIIMVAAVLFITTSALFLLTRQVRFATISNDSQDAYYAAESAGECILSYAQAGVFDKGIVQDIVCDGVTYRTDGSPKQTFKIKITNPTTGLETVAIVTVDTVKKTIDSLGYNSDDETLPTRLQRAITFRYKSYCPIGGDVMLVVDNSSSIDDSEMAVYKANLKYLVDRIYEADKTTRVGLITYGSAAKTVSDLVALDDGNHYGWLKTKIDAMSNMGRTHTSIALTDAWLQFQNLEEIDQGGEPPYDIVNSDGVKLTSGMVTDTRIITPAVNRDDEEFSNHVILFTDGSPNDWIATSSIKVNGILKPKGFWIDTPCKWKADGSMYADNNTVPPGCVKQAGVYTIPAPYSFLTTASKVKSLATLYTIAIGLDAGDEEEESLCLPNKTCKQIMSEAATDPKLAWIANSFDKARLDAITDEILDCDRPE